MLSPSANGPGRVGNQDDDARSASPPQPTQEPPQEEEGKEASSTATPEVVTMSFALPHSIK